MARVKNEFLELSGSVGDLTFREDSRGTIVQRKSGKKRKQSDRQKANSVEMGGASKAGKVFRKAFSGKDSFWMDTYFSGRLSGAFRRIVGMGEGDFGSRALDFRRNGSEILAGFDFVENRLLRHFIGGIGESGRMDEERSGLEWVSPELNRRTQMTVPEGATHFVFVLGAVPMSGFVFDKGKKQYVSMSDFRTSAFFVRSGFLSLMGDQILSQHLSIDFGESLPEEVGIIHFVGALFYREINGEMELIENSHTMRMLGVV